MTLFILEHVPKFKKISTVFYYFNQSNFNLKIPFFWLEIVAAAKCGHPQHILLIQNKCYMKFQDVW